MDHSSITHLPVPGCPGYRVGTDGTVETAWTRKGAGKGKARIGETWKALKPFSGKQNPYLTAVMRQESGGKRFWQIAWLVLEVFVGPRPLGMEACHGDGNPKNNALSNLRWDTPQANKDDRQRHGRTARGERNGKSVLSDARALEVSQSKGSLRAVARRFGISFRTVFSIRHGTRWVPEADKKSGE
jgi:hypothetical protein